MAKPVITTPVSPRIIAQGVAFSQAMAASGSPTAWAATGLPSGLVINETTGAISGTPLAQAQTTASITATNVDGTSDAVQIIFVVMATPPGMGGPFDIVLDYEMTTNEVSMPGVAAPTDGSPLFWAPRGTNRHLLVGVTYFGVLQDVNPEAEDVRIRLGLKELEPERLLELTVGDTEKIAAMPDDRQRYRIPFRVTPGNWTGPLSDYEENRGTEILALAELEVQVGVASTLHDATLADSSIAIEGDVTTPITGDHDFTGIAEFSVATPMRLTLTLAVVGRVLQTVELVRTFDLIFSGGVFVLSNLAGDTTGQGAVEGDKWRATLELTGLTGDANSVDVDYEITTTEDGTIPHDYVVLDGGSEVWVDWSTSHQLQLYAGASPVGTAIGFAGSGLTEEERADDIHAAWESESGAADVISVVWDAGLGGFVVSLSDTSLITGVEWTLSSSGSPNKSVIAGGTTGTATTCSVTARLEQLEDPSSVPLNLTSNQFRIGVARDMVPD